MTTRHAHRPLIVGTAGHIDHGKTALIRLLTGVDTDRLKQEKERGISIELGFASLTLPSGQQLGVIDVPGHERFIKNMLAGAGGIDLILFVIAGDEGVMPQTREHMDIIDLLGIERGVIALTKVDMVEADFVDIVEETVREYLDETCLKSAQVVRVSATTGEGREEILAALERVSAEVHLGERGHLTRLPIDRIFIMEGFGTVVTGTLWAGRLREGDSVRILPEGLTSRIKSLEVHNQKVGEALAGQRVAVVLHGVEKASIQRGDWVLAGDETTQATPLVDAQVRVLRSAEKPLTNGQRVRFHLGSAELLGRLVLLDGDELAPGTEGWVQLRLEKAILTERGDRFVLRTYSPMHTVAGGVVVTAGVGRRRRHRKEDLEALQHAASGSPEERVSAALARHGGRGAGRAELGKESGCTEEEVAGALAALVAASQARELSKRRIVAADGYATAAERLCGILEGYQRGNRLSWGILKSELKKRVESAIHADLVEAWVQEESHGGGLSVRGDRLRFGSDRLEFLPEHEALREMIYAYVREAGFSGRTHRELQEEVLARVRGGAQQGDGAKALRAMPADGLAKDIDALLLLLSESRDIARVPPHFFFSAELIDEAAERVRQFFRDHDEMRVADLKGLLEVTRKQAVPLLEHLDQTRVTQRRGDVRVAGPRLRAAEAEDSS